jgi:hypothetical protein
MLRERESELEAMITQFAHSSSNARDSADKLRAAGNEAEFNVKAAVAKGTALRNDLELMIDQAAALIEKIQLETERQASIMESTERLAKPEEPSLPVEAGSRVRPFSPMAAPAAPQNAPAETESGSPIEPRSDAERQLLAAIRAAKEGVA